MMRYRAYLWAAPPLLVCVLLVAMAFVSGPTQAKSGGFYRQTNLVSDLPKIAKFQDPNLVNSWGLSHGSATPWWVSDNGKGVSTLYKGDGTPFPVGSPLVVTIPPPAGSPAGTTSAPTGNVFNGTSDFVVTENNVSGPSLFIFATEDGTISGWNRNVDPTNAILEVDNSASGAVYKGLAMGSIGSSTDSTLSNDCPFTGQCFAPFGIQNINGNLYVTYALQKPGKHDDQAAWNSTPPVPFQRGRSKSQRQEAGLNP